MKFKFLFSFLTVLSLFLFFLSPVLAKVAPPTSGILAPEPGSASLQGFQAALNQDDYNKESFDFASLTGTLSSLNTLLLGCSIKDNKGKINYGACPEAIRVGALPMMGNMMAAMITNPPASGIQYFADIGQRLHLVKPAYAQGFGFLAVNPFVTAWRAVRNLTYIFFVVVLVVFGIMIMLRTKISPQAVITIQSALPRIIIGLILVTFSFAIVGLLIDLTYVVFGLLVYGLAASGLTIVNPGTAFNDYTTAGFFQIIGFIAGRGLGGVANIITGVTPGGGIVAVGGAAFGITTMIGSLLGLLTIATGGVGGAAAVAAAAVPVIMTAAPIVLGFILTIIFFLFRILFALARAYLLLLLHLILAPIFILFSVASGNGIWNGWLRGTLANLLVFPVVGIVIFFTGVLIDLLSQAGGNLWAPPYVAGNVDLLRGMIGLGAVMLLPTIPDFINQLLSIRGGLPVQLPGVQNQIQQLLQTVSQISSKYVGGGRAGVGPCMPLNTVISTHKGFMFIQNLRTGDLVWTINLAGEKILAAIEQIIKRPVPASHKMVSIILADGRQVVGSLPHPTVNGIPFGKLKIGDLLDNSYITEVKVIKYHHNFIYDILPKGETGAYWANNVLIGSTLFTQKQNFTTRLAL